MASAWGDSWGEAWADSWGVSDAPGTPSDFVCDLAIAVPTRTQKIAVVVPSVTFGSKVTPTLQVIGGG